MKYVVKLVGKKLIIFILLTSMALLLIRCFPLNVTASMPYGLYMRLPPWNVKEGDLVELDNPMDSSSLGVYVQHGLLKKVDHINEDGTYYVLGEHELSYDSRYFGAIEKKYITSKIIPIWTTKKLPKFLEKKNQQPTVQSAGV